MSVRGCGCVRLNPRDPRCWPAVPHSRLTISPGSCVWRGRGRQAGEAWPVQSSGQSPQRTCSLLGLSLLPGTSRGQPSCTTPHLAAFSLDSTPQLENWPGSCAHTDTHTQAHFRLPRPPPGLVLRPLEPGPRLLLPCWAAGCSLSPPQFAKSSRKIKSKTTSVTLNSKTSLKQCQD